jgi:hypothetical protein
MSEPTPVSIKSLYTSNFSGGTDGWSLNTSNGALGSLAASGGKLVATINNGGTQAWHVQLAKSPFSFQKDKMYQITVKAKAEANRSGTLYAGKNSDPWSSYSGYSGLNFSATEQTFIVAFTMGSPTDNAARIVFDLGTDATDITISEIKVEELYFPITGVDDLQQGNVKIFPNPTSSWVFIDNSAGFSRAVLYDINGRPRANYVLTANESTMNLENIPSGLYLMELFGNGLSRRLKIVKQ